MKRFYVACLILALMISFCFLTMSLTQRYAEDMSDRVKDLYDIVKSDEEQAEAKLLTLSDTWEKYEEKLAMYTKHSELENIGVSIAALREYYSNKSIEQFRVCSEQMLVDIEHLRNSSTPTLRNIL